MSILSSQKIVKRVVAAPAPILFLDTCALLDIIRAPVRENIKSYDIKAIDTLYTRVQQTPPSVVFIVNKQVHDEFHQHVNKVEKETGKQIKKMAKNFLDVLNSMSSFPGMPKLPSGIDLSTLGFPAYSRQIAEQLVNCCLIVSDVSREKINALNRVQKAIPPATQGKQSVKDCLIIETYLRVARELKAAGHSFNKVFTTANHKDYQQGSSRLHPILRGEFNSVGLEYSPSWSAAMHELDR